MTTSQCTSNHTMQSTQGTSALVIHHSAWVGRHTGGPGQHPQYTGAVNERELWVAQHQAQAQHRISHATISGKHNHISSREHAGLKSCKAQGLRIFVSLKFLSSTCHVSPALVCFLSYLSIDFTDTHNTFGGTVFFSDSLGFFLTP